MKESGRDQRVRFTLSGVIRGQEKEVSKKHRYMINGGGELTFEINRTIAHIWVTGHITDHVP